MAYDNRTPGTETHAERRCPNCGARVAREANTCFMCGQDLRVQPKRRRRVSWIDALLVVAVLAVLVFWWRMSARPRAEVDTGQTAELILPTNVPLLAPTDTPTPDPTPSPTSTPVPAKETFVTHVVKPGETLLGIAGAYGVTVDQIQQANNIGDALIRVGDELTIPVLREGSAAAPVGNVTNFNYTVESGDTIATIAARFGSTIQDILDANQLAADDVIRPGDDLIVPVRQVPAEVVQAAEETPANVETGDLTPQPEGAIYIEPRLVGPANRSTISREEPVLLRWVSVDVLAPNEWYVLMIYPTEGAALTLPSIWTKATSHRLEQDLAPDEGESATYSWQVSVVRVTTGPDGERILEPVSPPSALRQFTWE